MSRNARLHRMRRRPVPPPVHDDVVTVQQLLGQLARDVAELAVKEQLGEPLSPAERAALEAARAAAQGGES
jgi:hypothetical protein